MATNIQDSINKYQDLLRNSRTANDPGVDPTASDVSTQRSLIQAKTANDTAKSEALKKAWYGSATGEASDTEKKPVGSKKGALGNLLHNLGVPLYTIVGGVENVLGRGTSKGLKNIQENIEQEGTFGDILRGYGVNNAASMPLGLLLDVFMDPVSWLTLGTGSTVGRTLFGAAKGGLTGAKLGLKSAGLQRLESAGRIIPGLSKRAFSAGTQAEGKLPTLYRNISKASGEASDAYRAAVGQSMSDNISSQLGKTPIFTKVGDWLENQGTWGPKVKKAFAYDTQKTPEDVLDQFSFDNEELFNRGDTPWANIFNGKLDSAKKIINDSSHVAFNPQFGKAADSTELFGKLKAMAKDEEPRVRNIYQKNMEKLITTLSNTDDERSRRILANIYGMDESQLKEFSSVYDNYRSGLDAYDKTMAQALTSTTGRKILGTYAKYIGLFKVGKIGGNLLTATTNMTVGNLVMMMMHGLDITNTELLGEVNKARKALYGKDFKALNAILSHPEMKTLMRENPREFRAVLGIKPEKFNEANEMFRTEIVQFLEDAAKSGKYSKSEIDDFTNNVLNDKFDDIIKKTSTNLENLVRQTTSTIDSAGINTSLTSEILTGPFNDVVNKVKKYADKSGSPLAKAAHWYLTRPMDLYSKGDQVFRLGMMNHLLTNGITEAELQQLTSRGINIFKEDIQRIANTNRYRILPRSSLNISKEMFMNYMAMPGFVRIMRTLPIVGSPFFSFIYGMTAMTAKTAASNPSVFNKVQFGLKEVTGERSPLEKMALKSPYYEWYNKDGMIKIPFFKENPVYLNMQNMLPYYTMNIFQPMERTYDERFGATTAAILDKLPFLKSPDGQLLFDYLIQPMILQQSEPQGVFGQKLYPTGATTAQKAGYAASAAVETVMPPMLGFLGLATPISDDAIKYLPSYRWRQVAYGVRGKTSIGATAKEPASSRTIRNLMSTAGLPTYSIDLKYVKNK